MKTMRLRPSLTTVWGSMGTVCGLVLLLPTGPTLAQSIDTSGLDLFWQVADRLSSGERLVEADWDDLFDHPGYAVTEAAGQRKSVVSHCMLAVFSPDGDLEAALRRLPQGDRRTGLYERVCNHLQEVRLRRSELDGRFATFDAGALVAEGRSRALRYLPTQGPETVPPPAVYLILFEEQGFGRPDAIVVDGLAVMTRSDDHNAGLLGHELHHSYRSALRDPLPDAAGPELLVALERIISEGVASMIDKASYVRRGETPSGFPPDFLDLVAEAPARLARIDSALAAAEPTADGFATAARVVTGNSPWGGHLNGVYMAIAIEDAFGSAEVVSAQWDPLAFFTAYQRAVETLTDGRFRFSDRSIRLIAEAMSVGSSEPSPEIRP
jgi:hypothetical protein